jgi:serine protease inhibitor
MQPLRPMTFLFLLLGAAACGEATVPEPGPNLAAVDPRLVNAYTGFGLALFKEVVRQEGSTNVFLSPASVAFALSMTYHGAADETRAAMARTLEIAGMTPDEIARANQAWRASLANPDPQVQLAIANSVWAREGIPFKQEFLQLNRDFYHAEIAALDFSRPDASRTINEWVSGSTEGKIKEIVPAQIDPQTVMYLINAIYFKGTWTDRFDRASTREGDWHLPSGSVKRHPMMSRTGNYGVLRGEGFQAVSLPYGNGRMSMYIFLPDEGSSPARLYSQLTTARWEQWMQEFREARILLMLPRFTLEYETSLVEALDALGMGIAFDEQRANFESMLPREFLERQNAYINDVKHKTFVEVNEEGTEAAAATSVEVSVTSMPPSFIVDRPFLAAIRDNATGTLLFMGQITEPN